MTTRQQSAALAAKAKIQQDYRQALAMYGSPFPSELEIQHAILEAKLLRLKQAASVIGNVADRLTPSSTQKKSCGCTGKSGSAGYQTKSMQSSGSRQSRNYFAENMGQICKEQYMDAEYTRFCEAYL